MSELTHARPSGFLPGELGRGVTPDAHAPLARLLLGRRQQIERVSFDRGDDVTLPHKVQTKESRIPLRPEPLLRLQIVTAHPIGVVERHDDSGGPALEPQRLQDENPLPGRRTSTLAEQLRPEIWSLEGVDQLRRTSLTESRPRGAQRQPPFLPPTFPIAQLRGVGGGHPCGDKTENEGEAGHDIAKLATCHGPATAKPCLLIARNLGRSRVSYLCPSHPPTVHPRPHAASSVRSPAFGFRRHRVRRRLQP